MAVKLELLFTDLKVFLTLLFSDSNVYYGIVLGLIFGILTGWIVRGKFSKQTTEDSCDGRKIISYVPGGSGEYKMVLVVRQDLGMGKGKVAAQCSHAAVGLCQQLLYDNPKLLKKWENSASPKVVVKAPDEDTLIDLARNAKSKGLETCIIRDAGRTQIAPGSKTVLGVGPGPKELVDEITGHLKLF